MTAVPASALLGQFAEEITPAGQTVFGLKAQPFADNNGAALGDIVMNSIHVEGSRVLGYA